jgi:hypothetical protein
VTDTWGAPSITVTGAVDVVESAAREAEFSMASAVLVRGADRSGAFVRAGGGAVF